MKDLVKKSIETALGSLTAEEDRHRSAKESLAGEVKILESHSLIVERAEVAGAAERGLIEMIEARKTKDYIRLFAEQVVTDSTRMDLLAGQLASWEFVERNRHAILAEVHKITVAAAKSDLAEFEKAHAAILRKHGAIA